MEEYLLPTATRMKNYLVKLSEEIISLEKTDHLTAINFYQDDDCHAVIDLDDDPEAAMHRQLFFSKLRRDMIDFLKRERSRVKEKIEKM